MSVDYKVTLQEIPNIDNTPNLDGASSEFNVVRPSGNGWTLVYSFKGNHYIYNFWKRGGTIYDFGLTTTFTSVGDDVQNGLIGQGEEAVVEVSTGESQKTKDVEFIPDQTYLFGGKASWNGTGSGDKFRIDVIAKPTPIVTDSTNGDVKLDGNKIIPESSNPTHKLDGIPVIVPNNDGTGYWELDNNKNLVPSENNDGNIDLYTVEMKISTLINDIHVDNNDVRYNELVSKNAWKVLYGHKFRITVYNNSDTNWKLSLIMYMIRKATTEIEPT